MLYITDYYDMYNKNSVRETSYSILPLLTRSNGYMGTWSNEKVTL